MSTEEPEKPDEPTRPLKRPTKPPDFIHNPYDAPREDNSAADRRPPSTLDTLWQSLGIGLVVILLFIVVGFGLLVGCCAIGGF